MGVKGGKKGICNICGKVLENKNGFYCDQCRPLASKASLERVKAKQQERLAKGLCRHCERPALPDEQYCEYHLKLIRDRHRRKVPYERSQEYREANGLCWVCGKKVEDPFYKMCNACRQRRAEASRKKHKQTKEEEYAKRMVRYYERKEAGLCTKCGAPATHGTFCYKCYIAQRKAQQKFSAEKRAQTQLKKDNKICLWCGAPIEPESDKVYCKKCREKLSQKMREIKKGISGNHPWNKENDLYCLMRKGDKI